MQSQNHVTEIFGVMSLVNYLFVYSIPTCKSSALPVNTLILSK